MMSQSGSGFNRRIGFYCENMATIKKWIFDKELVQLLSKGERAEFTMGYTVIYLSGQGYGFYKIVKIQSASH